MTTLIFFVKAHPDVLIDEEDLLKFGIYNASFQSQGYIQLTIEGKKQYLHRAIMGYPKLKVDHRNRNPKDNRKENLRLVTDVDNASNTSAHLDGKSSFKGVSRSKGKYWRAQLMHKGKIYCLGYHTTQELAAKAYDNKAKELHGDFAVLNFPEES